MNTTIMFLNGILVFHYLKKGWVQVLMIFFLSLVNLNMCRILAFHFFSKLFSLLFNNRTCICWMHFQMKR